MNRIQPVRFPAIDDFLGFLPDNERPIVDFLRQLVLDSIPQVREKLAYNVPFYYRHSRICYIWPSAVPWGNVKPRGVQLGFTKGFLLRDELNYLEKGNRKQVYIKTFFDRREIDVDILRAYLHEATEIDSGLRLKGSRDNKLRGYL